jgi:hypothetical protein
MFDVVNFRRVFSDSLSNVDRLVVKICGPSVHHGVSAYIINAGTLITSKIRSYLDAACKGTFNTDSRNTHK